MRFRPRRFSREQCRRGGRKSQEVQAAKRRKGQVIRRPDAGTLLRVITIEDCLSGTSTRILVRQGERKNQVVPECFGRVGSAMGWDRIMRRFRALCVCRWIEENG